MDIPKRHRRLIRVLLWVWAGYLVAGNLFVATPIGQNLIAPHPERFTIQWGPAWTVVPGLVQVRNLEIQQHSKDIIWNLKIDRAITFVNILALPFKTFNAILPRARGIEVSVKATDTTMAPPNKTKPGFRIRLSGISVKDVRFIDFFDMHIEGEDVRIGGGLDSTARGPMGIPRAKLKIKNGQISHKGAPLATDLNLDCRARIEKHLKSDLTEAGVFPLISGSVKTTGDIADLRFIGTFVRSVSWMQVSGGSGTIDADLKIKKGVLDSKSRMDIQTSAFTYNFLDYAITGKGKIVIAGRKVDDLGDTKLDFDLADFALGYADSETPHVEGNNLSLTVVGHLAEMTGPNAAVEVTIELPESDVPDLRVYNRLFKDTTPMKILSGAGRITTRLKMTTGPGGMGEGAVEIKTKGVSVTMKGKNIVADVESRTLIKTTDRKNRVFALDGSSIKITNAGVGIPDEKKPEVETPRDWWCTIDINDGSLKLSKPVEVSANLALTAFDVAPLLALMSKTQKSADRLDKLLGIHDFEGGAHIAVENGATHIGDLHAEGGRADILGNLCLKKDDTRGAIYIKYGIISLAVEMTGDDEKKHLTGPRKWYDNFTADFTCN